MAFIFFLNRFSYTYSTCSILDNLPEQCASFYGCTYCQELQACVPEPNCPADNSISAKNSQAKIGLCHIYNDDGCNTCVSGRDGLVCGWIQSVGVCVEGDKFGPFGIKSAPADWLFNKTRCRRSLCASLKTEKKCQGNSQCRWSKRQHICTIRRTPNEMNAKVPESVGPGTTNISIISSAVLFAIVCIVAVIGFLWKKSHVSYSNLTNINVTPQINLDDLPKPN